VKSPAIGTRNKAVSVQVKFTYEDYLLFPDDGRRHELIDGEHYMTPAPSTAHQRLTVRLSTAFENFLKLRNIGQIFVAPTDVVLSNLDVVQPDLVFVSSAKVSIITTHNIQGAPDLLIEILSEGTRKTDEIIKRKLYERCGVQEYWIVDPELETVKIYRTTPQGYSRVAELSHETRDTLTTPLLPDLTVPLIDLFK
jgi:Uma2 family endonuclease